MSRRGGARIVGLTSPARRAFVAGLGVYDVVLTYDEAAEAPGDRAVLVDIAGRATARDAVHARFGDGLVHSMTVGLSNAPDPAALLTPPPPIGPAPEVFFAQLQVAKRAQEWGQSELDRRMDDAWASFLAFTDTWLTIRSAAGAAAVDAAWHQLLTGDLDPTIGLDLTLWDQ